MKETPTPTLKQYIDKIVGVPGRVKHQVTTAPVRGTTDARDPDVQKKTLAGNGIVMARAGNTARVGRPVELSQVQHTEGAIDVRAVIQQQTPAIRTVQETAEVPQRQQLDRVVDVAVMIQPTYSKPSFEREAWRCR